MKKTSRLVQYVPIVAASFLMTGCFYDDPIEPDVVEDTLISYDLDIQPIFNTNCTSCHPLIIPAPDLTPDISYEALISNEYIVPKDAASSTLYQKLKGKPNIMPPSGPLPEEDINLVQLWIEQGALNN